MYTQMAVCIQIYLQDILNNTSNLDVKSETQIETIRGLRYFSAKCTFSNINNGAGIRNPRTWYDGIEYYSHLSLQLFFYTNRPLIQPNSLMLLN